MLGGSILLWRDWIVVGAHCADCDGASSLWKWCPIWSGNGPVHIWRKTNRQSWLLPTWPRRADGDVNDHGQDDDDEQIV